MTKIAKTLTKAENKLLGKLNKSGGIGRSIAKVLSPIIEGKQKIRAEVGRFARSKVGRVIITAVAIYFGGAALAGAMGGGAAAATGATGWAGAAQGLAGAWNGVVQAGSALAAGEFSAAGSALSTGAAGGSAIGADAATSAAWGSGAGLGGDTLSAMNGAANVGGNVAGNTAGAIGNTAANIGANAATNTAINTATNVATPAVTNTGSGMIAPVSYTNAVPQITTTMGAAPAAQPTMWQSFMANKYTAPALISAGTGMLQSVAGQRSADSAYARYQAEREAELERYNKNVGVRLRRGG